MSKIINLKIFNYKELNQEINDFEKRLEELIIERAKLFYDGNDFDERWSNNHPLNAEIYTILMHLMRLMQNEKLPFGLRSKCGRIIWNLNPYRTAFLAFRKKLIDEGKYPKGDGFFSSHPLLKKDGKTGEQLSNRPVITTDKFFGYK